MLQRACLLSRRLLPCAMAGGFICHPHGLATGWSVCRSQTWRHRSRARLLTCEPTTTQHVYKGDVLYVIEKFDFAVALDNAKATILTREADLAVKNAQNAPRAR